MRGQPQVTPAEMRQKPAGAQLMPDEGGSCPPYIYTRGSMVPFAPHRHYRGIHVYDPQTPTSEPDRRDSRGVTRPTTSMRRQDAGFDILSTFFVSGNYGRACWLVKNNIRNFYLFFNEVVFIK